MKKIYTLAVATLACLSATAQSQSVILRPGMQVAKNHEAAPAKAPAKADAEAYSLTLGYCDEISTAFGVNDGKTGMAVRFPAEMLAPYVGNQITAINVASPVDASKSNNNTQTYVNSLTDVEVFLSEKVGGDPFCVTQGTLGTTAFEYYPIELSTPYTIEEGKDVVINVMFDGITPNDFPIVTDYTYTTNADAGWLYSRFKGVDSQGYIILQDAFEWKAWTTYGGAFCLTATVSGDNMPMNMGTISSVTPPMLIKPGEPFELEVEVYNEGADPLQQITLDVNIADQETQTVTASVMKNDGTLSPVAFHQTGVGVVTLTCDEEGYQPYTITLSKVNGKENALSAQSATGQFLCMEKGYPYNVVVEEMTSTTCSACPIGITGMEMTKEKYGDRFVGIGVHCQVPSKGDPMTVTIYQDGYMQFEKWVGQANGGQLSAPSAFVNRNFSNNLYPTPNGLDNEMKKWLAASSPVQVSATITTTDDPTKITLNVETEAALDLDKPFGISYAVVEDNVGPYPQFNGYAGYGGYAYGWEEKGKYVDVIYNEVARRGSKNTPDADSYVEGLKKGEPSKYSTTVDLSYVTDLNAYSVAVMLINRENGEVVNATSVKSPSYVGVDNVFTDRAKYVAAPINGGVYLAYTGNVYSIDGTLVAAGVEGDVALPRGMYIVATAKGNAKVMVK